MFSKSRHQTIASDSSSLSSDFGAPPTDEAHALSSEWLIRHAEHEKLIRRWQRLEARLIRDYDLFKLSERERASLQEASDLDAINARLFTLHAQNQKRLAALPRLAATTTDGVVSKLSVALAIIQPEESREAHLLIKSILRDLEIVAQNGQYYNSKPAMTASGSRTARPRSPNRKRRRHHLDPEMKSER
jgi:hypothetical protein